MRSILTVSTAATNTAVTTRDRLKAELAITTTTDDDYLDAQITSVSAYVCSYLNVIPAQDGTCNIGRETVIETIRADEALRDLPVSRRPIVSITSIVENDVTLTADTDFEYDATAGLLHRLYNGFETYWPCGKIVVTYVAGWLMPDDGSDVRNLPTDIEDAAIELVKAARAGRTRDPALRSENILSGLYSYTLFDPSNMDEWPVQITGRLDRYRNTFAG